MKLFLKILSLLLALFLIFSADLSAQRSCSCSGHCIVMCNAFERARCECGWFWSFCYCEFDYHIRASEVDLEEIQLHIDENALAKVDAFTQFINKGSFSAAAKQYTVDLSLVAEKIRSSNDRNSRLHMLLVEVHRVRNLSDPKESYQLTDKDVLQMEGWARKNGVKATF